MGSGSGSGNDLVVKGSQVLIAPGSTTNGLQTMLDPDTDMRVQSNGVFGQGSGFYADTYNAGYTQIVILGGDGNNDTIELQAESSVYGQLYAREHVVTLKGNSAWYGSALVKKIAISGDLEGPAMFAVDEGLTGTTISDPTNFQVFARWRSDY